MKRSCVFSQYFFFLTSYWKVLIDVREIWWKIIIRIRETKWEEYQWHTEMRSIATYLNIWRLLSSMKSNHTDKGLLLVSVSFHILRVGGSGGVSSLSVGELSSSEWPLQPVSHSAHWGSLRLSALRVYSRCVSPGVKVDTPCHIRRNCRFIDPLSASTKASYSTAPAWARPIHRLACDNSSPFNRTCSRRDWLSRVWVWCGRRVCPRICCLPSSIALWSCSYHHPSYSPTSDPTGFADEFEMDTGLLEHGVPWELWRSELVSRIEFIIPIPSQ